jgi:uncharacterized membrane protein YtjA (UPF0391 family)
MNLDRELGLAQAERINRLLGLNKIRYIIAIPVGIAAGYLAGLAGASTMVATVMFVVAQAIYGALVGWVEVRRERQARRREFDATLKRVRAEAAREFDEEIRRLHAP